MYDTLVETYLLIFREMGLSEDDIKQVCFWLFGRKWTETDSLFLLQIFYGTAARFYKIFEYAPKNGKL